MIELQLEQWYKQHLLDPQQAERRIAEYYRERGFTSAHIVPSRTADEFNDQLASDTVDDRRSRLKRIWEVRLQNAQGEWETRYVLAKSVGWGWLGDHALLTCHQLCEFVPTMLGLRDGMLYTEWLPQSTHAIEDDQDKRMERAALYVAGCRTGSWGSIATSLPHGTS